MKFDEIKPFVKNFLYSKPRKHFNLTIALSCLKADFHVLLKCKLKLKWLSGPILEFKGSVQYVQKGHLNMVTQADMILQN